MLPTLLMLGTTVVDTFAVAFASNRFDAAGRLVHEPTARRLTAALLALHEQHLADAG